MARQFYINKKASDKRLFLILDQYFRGAVSRCFISPQPKTEGIPQVIIVFRQTLYEPTPERLVRLVTLFTERYRYGTTTLRSGVFVTLDDSEYELTAAIEVENEYGPDDIYTAGEGNQWRDFRVS
jgi:hypothetical protein